MMPVSIATQDYLFSLDGPGSEPYSGYKEHSMVVPQRPEHILVCGPWIWEDIVVVAFQGIFRSVPES